MLRARDATTGSVVAERLRVADTHWTRLRGLLGTSSLPRGDGLWIRPCRQVHMFGMRYAIDVVFLDDAYRVVGVVEALPPGKVSPRIATATSVIELPAGTIAGARLVIGTDLAIDGTREAAAGLAGRLRALVGGR